MRVQRKDWQNEVPGLVCYLEEQSLQTYLGNNTIQRWRLLPNQKFPQWIRNHWRTFAGLVSYELIAAEGPLKLVIQEDGTLSLKTNNQLVVNVPPNCTLLIRNSHANGRVVLNVEGADIQSVDAYRESNKQGIMDPTSQ